MLLVAYLALHRTFMYSKNQVFVLLHRHRGQYRVCTFAWLHCCCLPRSALLGTFLEELRTEVPSMGRQLVSALLSLVCFSSVAPHCCSFALMFALAQLLALRLVFCEWCRLNLASEALLFSSWHSTAMRKRWAEQAAARSAHAPESRTASPPPSRSPSPASHPEVVDLVDDNSLQPIFSHGQAQA